MANSTQNISNWKPEIDTFVQDEKDNLPKSTYSSLFTERTTNRLQLSDINYSNVTPFMEVGELEDGEEDSLVEGYRFNYNRKHFRKIVTFSNALYQNDQLDTAEEMARAPIAMRQQSRDLHAFSMFRRAWDSNRTFGDGVTLISTAHPKKASGGTQANTYADGVQLALSYDNALTLQDQLLSVTSNNGNLLSIGDTSNNKLLVVPTALRETAFQIAGVNADDRQPDTADNNANYFRKGDKFDVLVTKYLSYEAARQMGETAVAKSSASNYFDSMWFIVDTALAKKYFKFYEQEGYPYEADKFVEENESMKYYFYDSYAYGNSGFFPIVGSKGDGTTFSG